MDNPHIRFLKAYEYLRSKGSFHSQLELSKLIRKPQPHISAALKGDIKRLGNSMLNAIADAFPNLINKEYMLTGEGSLEVDPKEYRPHLADVAVAAGFMNGIAEQAHEYEMRAFMPEFSDYDFSINVSGDSMLPNIHPGDTVYCRIEQDRHADVIGKLCLIDTVEGAVLKIIQKEGKNHITLHSYNPDYPDYKVPYEDIIRIGRIVGLTRKF